MLMKRRGVFFAMFLVLVLAGVVVAQSFDVSSLLLKVSVQEGDSVSKPVTVNARSDGDYRVSVIGIDGVSVDEGTFSLSNGDSKRVDVNFDSKGVELGVGVGSLRIRTR